MTQALGRSAATSSPAPADSTETQLGLAAIVAEVNAGDPQSFYQEADAFTQVMAEGWASDPVPLARAYALMLEPGSRHRLYLARVNGEPAAAAGAVFFARSAYLLGGVVLPRFCARGLYRALVAARLADARDAGLKLVTSNSIADTSAPILERMGFERLCPLIVFRG